MTNLIPHITGGIAAMSKVGNYRLELQETEDYLWGWHSAERGELALNWLPDSDASIKRYQAQVLNWYDHHDTVRQP